MTIYTVRVVGADGSVGQGCTVCTIYPCLYVHQVTHVTDNYSIFVTSMNQDGTLGSQNSTTFGKLKHPLHTYTNVTYSRIYLLFPSKFIVAIHETYFSASHIVLFCFISHIYILFILLYPFCAQ